MPASPSWVPPIWASAFLLVNKLVPAAAPTLAAARALKKSLRVRGRANSSTPGTLIVCFSMVSFLLPNLAGGNAERGRGINHRLERQARLEGQVVRRQYVPKDVDRNPVLAFHVVDGERRREEVLALQRRGRTPVSADPDRLQRRRVSQERRGAAQRVRREGQLRWRGHRGAQGRQGPRKGIRVRHRSEERRVGKECRSRWSPYH